MAENLVNDFDTQLNGAIDDSQTSLVVDATTAVAADFRIRIDDELMLVTDATTTTWTVTRGIEGTTPAAHADNAFVFAVITAAGLQQWATDRYSLVGHDHDADYAPITHGHDASEISAADAGGYFTGTDVEAQLQELGAAAGTGSGPSLGLVVAIANNCYLP